MNKGQRNNMKACLRGGKWDDSSAAGVAAVNLNNVRTNSNNNVGGRDCVFKPKTTMVDIGNRGMCCPAISEIKNEGGLLSNLNVESQATSKKTKRASFLFEQAFTMENLYLAFMDARKGKRKKRATMRFEINLGAQLKELYEEIHSGIYRPRAYVQFFVYEPKKRVINAPAFRDLVVQHAIYRVIYTIFDSSFIDTSYACRKGGGTHRASVYTQKEMRKYDGDLYYVKLDIRKFFYSIDRGILRKLFEKKIKDKRFVNLMCEFAEMNETRGIPIGNLLSQIYALIYMNPVDQFIKRELKAKSYVRYVDDMVIIGVSREEAIRVKDEVEAFVKRELCLEYSHWMVSKIKRGINFVGYRTWKSVKFVRKHSMYKFRKAIKKSKIESIISLIGHAKGTATCAYFRKMLVEHEIFTKIPPRSQACLNT